MRVGRVLGVLAVGGAILAPAASAAQCVRVGVYQDNPLRTFGALQKANPKVKTIATYVTGGTLIDPKIIQMANKRNLTLVVTWAPDGGIDKPVQPKFRLTKITTGKYDMSLRALGNHKPRRRAGTGRPGRTVPACSGCAASCRSAARPPGRYPPGSP